MLTQTVAGRTFDYSYCIGGRMQTPANIAMGSGDTMYVLCRGSERTPNVPANRATGNVRICVFTTGTTPGDEELVAEFGHGGDGEGEMTWPVAIALDSEENLHITDEWLNRISIFTKDGEWVGKWGTPGDGDGEIDRPSGLAFDKDDNLYLVDSRNHRVQVFTKDGKFLFQWGRSGDSVGEFNYPWGIEIDGNGDVYVADWRNDRIQKFAPDGRFIMSFGMSGQSDGEFDRPTAVAVDRDGTIYVTDFKNDRLQVFDADGNFITKLAGEATLSKWGKERVEIDPMAVRGREIAQGLHEREKAFQGPIAVEVDDEGRVFVVETARHRIQVFQKQTAIFQEGGLL